MEMFIYLFSYPCRETRHRLQINQAGGFDSIQASEMLQKRPLPPGADPRDIAQRRLQMSLAPDLAMIGDCKAMSFVT